MARPEGPRPASRRAPPRPRPRRRRRLDLEGRGVGGGAATSVGAATEVSFRPRAAAAALAALSEPRSVRACGDRTPRPSAGTLRLPSEALLESCCRRCCLRRRSRRRRALLAELRRRRSRRSRRRPSFPLQRRSGFFGGGSVDGPSKPRLLRQGSTLGMCGPLEGTSARRIYKADVHTSVVAKMCHGVAAEAGPPCYLRGRCSCRVGRRRDEREAAQITRRRRAGALVGLEGGDGPQLVRAGYS